MNVVTLFPDERLHEIVERESGRGRFALIVPEIEERPLLEQERLAALLAGPRGFCAGDSRIPQPEVVACFLGLQAGGFCGMKARLCYDNRPAVSLLATVLGYSLTAPGRRTLRAAC